MSRLSLSLFGPLRLHTGDGAEIVVNADKVRGLLAYLAVEAGRPHRRETLAGLLWPGYPEHSARKSLSQALFVLNRTLTLADASSPLTVTRLDVQLNCEGCALDTGVFESRLAAVGRHRHPAGQLCDECAGYLRESLDLYRGEFLEGFSLRDSPEFEEWALMQRERYHREAAEAASTLARAREGEEALASARRWVALDPIDEAAHRRVMLLLAGSGRRTLALAQYDTCRRALRKELAVEPEGATRALFERIRTGDPSLVRAPGTAVADEPLTNQTIPGYNLPAQAAGQVRGHSARHNLPAAVDSFVGREREMDQVRALLLDPIVRLVTLTGTGGIGKTRLALEIARHLVEDYAGGAWLVDLAPLYAGSPAKGTDEAEDEATGRDRVAVAHAVSSALAVTEADKVAGGDAHIASLATAIEGRPLLLLVDGCEPILSGVVSVLAQLLAHCPDLTILATSREPLRVAGEHLYEVPPLAVPAEPFALAGETLAPDLDGALACGAVRLLAERVGAVHYGAAIDQSNVTAAVAICRRLDGLPLAIELAAARLNVLTLEDLARRLDGQDEGVRVHKRWDLLNLGSRAAPVRQRTLMNTLDWSYSLLDTDERCLFDRLGAFAGTFDMAAAEAICGEPDPDGARPSLNVSMMLAGLVDCSLVQRVQGRAEGQRYRLLETLRAYAQDRLEERGEAYRVAERHAGYYAALAEAAHPVIWSGAPELVGVLAELDAEHDNLAAAMHWCLAEGQKDTAIRIGAGANMWAMYHARISQYGEWTRAALALRGEVSPLLRARGLEVVSTYLMRAGRSREQAVLLPELLAAAHEAGDPRREAWALWQQALHLRDTGEHGRCVELLRESLVLARAAGDATMVRYDEAFLAVYEERGVRLPRLEALVERAPYGQRPYLETLCSRLALQDGDLEGTERHYVSAIRGWEGLGNPLSGRLMAELASLRALRGDPSETDSLTSEGLRIVRRAGDQVGVPLIRLAQGKIAWQQGDDATAQMHLEECLRFSERLDRPGLAAQARLALAYASAGQSAFEQASARCSEAEAASHSREGWLAAGIAAARGWIAYLRGGYAVAADHWRQALEGRRALDWRTDTAEAAEHLGWALAGAGELVEAAVLMAEARSERDAMGMVLLPVEIPHHERAVALVGQHY